MAPAVADTEPASTGSPAPSAPSAPPGKGARSFRSPVGLSLATIALALVIMEIVLRVATAVSPSLDDLISVPSSPVVADDELGWRGSPRYRSHDAAGFRNRTVLSRADVVALGDSQTYGYKL